MSSTTPLSRHRFSRAKLDLSVILKTIAEKQLCALGGSLIEAAIGAAREPLTEFVTVHTKSLLALLSPARKMDRIITNEHPPKSNAKAPEMLRIMERYVVNHEEMVALRLEEQRLARKEENLTLGVEQRTLADEEVRKWNEMLATNIDESVMLRLEELRLAQVAKELEKQKLIDTTRAEEMKTVEMEQRRLAEAAVQTANERIARNHQEMVHLRIRERSIAGGSQAGEERFAIMQRRAIACSVGQKLEERITLYREQQSIAHCLTVKLAEEATLGIALAQGKLRWSEQCMAVEMEQQKVVQRIQEKLDERLALQMQQQDLVEATRTKSSERVAVNAEILQLVEAIKHNLEAKDALKAELEMCA